MTIGRLEKTLELWVEELKVSPEKTTIKASEIKRLKKAIDKWYVMQTKANMHVEKYEEWVKKLL